MDDDLRRLDQLIGEMRPVAQATLASTDELLARAYSWLIEHHAGEA
jgi:hypothetical protein